MNQLGKLLGNVAAALALAAGIARAQADFPFRNNDVVVFLGDSNTAGAGYAKMLENFTLVRYPARKVVFYNAPASAATRRPAVRRVCRQTCSTATPPWSSWPLG